MEKARELLTSSDLSIEEIARKLNFSSGAYFRKCFKEYYNASPREMRKMGGI
jgi:transcriptional regulator GlxA family with amidase domain